MGNAYSNLRRLLAPAPLWIGEVSAHNADGTSTVQLPGGAYIRPRGQSVAVGSQAFVQGGEIAGQAPDLPLFDVEV